MSTKVEVMRERCTLTINRLTPDTLCIQLAGHWTLGADLPPIAEVQHRLDAEPQVRRLQFHTTALAGWDSVLLAFLLKLSALCVQRNIAFDRANLPDGVQDLPRLATAVPERTGARRAEVRESRLTRIGKATLSGIDAIPELLAFLGQATVAFAKLLVGLAGFEDYYPSEISGGMRGEEQV